MITSHNNVNVHEVEGSEEADEQDTNNPEKNIDSKDIENES